MRLLEKCFELLKAENIGLKEELKIVKAEAKSNTSTIADMEAKLKEIQGYSIANERYSRRKNITIFGLNEDAGENCTTKVHKSLAESWQTTIS